MRKWYQVLLGGVGGLIVGVALMYGFGSARASRSFDSGAEISGNHEYELALVDDNAEDNSGVTWTVFLDSDTGGQASGSCGKGTKASINLADGNWRVVKFVRSVPGPTPTEPRTDYQYDPLTPTKNLIKFDGLFVKSFYVCVVKEKSAGEAPFITPVGLKSK